MIIIELIYNLSILISISILAGFIENRWRKITFPGALLQGFLFGGAAIIGMLNPFIFAPGIIFDGRSVLLSLCGLFFGPISASIAAILALLYRIMLGGSGLIMGVSVIITSTVIGIGAFYFRRAYKLKPNSFFLYIVGIIVHVFMIGYMFFLPSPIRHETINRIALTVIGIYPFATILIGKILFDQEERGNLLREVIQNEKDSSTTLMSIGDGVITTNLQGRITRMNKMAEKITGWEFKEAKGTPIQNVFSIHDVLTKVSLSNPVDEVLKRKQITNHSENSILINRFGEEVNISNSAYPILNEQEKIQGVILVFSDITSRYLIEKELSKERNLLRTLIDSLPFSIYIKDKNYRKLLVNKTELEYLDRTEEEIIGKDDYELFPFDMAKNFMDDDRQVIEEGIPVIDRKEYLPLAHDRRRWISTTKIPWKDEKGAIIGLIGFGLNISDKIGYEAKIKKLSEAIEQSPIAVIITDRNGVIEYTNPRFEDMTGYKEKNVIGKVARILKGKNISAEVHKEIWDTILAGNKWRGEYFSKKKNDIFYWESVMISPIFDSQNQITNFILIIEDITERKNLINELVETKEKAIESDKLKSAFLANMSHEIRTPMNGILGFTELLKDPDLKFDDQRLYLSVIEQSGQRLLNLINDIIDISKIEAGQIVLTPEKVNVNNIIEAEYLFFLSEAEHKGLKLVYKKGLPDIEAFIKTDQNRLNQILTNLIKNSIKFTPSGTIDFGYVNKGQFLEFYVSDDGIGITSEMRERIFERFHQGDLVLTRRYEGAGLGLSISKALVEMLGGTIWVENNTSWEPQGKGSTFKFTIPYTQV